MIRLKVSEQKISLKVHEDKITLHSNLENENYLRIRGSMR